MHGNSRRLTICTLLGALVFGITACGEHGGVQDEGAATTASSSSTDGIKHVALDLTDTVCHLNDPGALIRVSGVDGSPKGSYYTVAQYRASKGDDWSQYPLSKYDPVGESSEANSMLNWKWSCTADNHSQTKDKPGSYRFRIYWPDKEHPKAQTDWKMITVK